MDCCIHIQDMDAYFDERKAQSEVAQCLKKGTSQMNKSLVTHSTSLLRHILRANGVFSGLSGLLFAVAGGPIANFIGLPSPLALVVVGLGLIGYAAALFTASNRAELNRQEVIAFIVMDVAWVVGSGLLLITAWIPFTLGGKWAVAIAADAVALFALGQFVGLRRMK